MPQVLNAILERYDMGAPPATIPLRKAARVLRSPVLGGVIVAFFIITHFWPAGFDALLYYLRWPPPNATTPYWVYLATYPLSWLGWPLSWQVLAAATVIAASLVYALRGNSRWWVVVASSPLIFNAWWGQVEVFSLLGILTGLLVLQKKLPAVWIAAVWLLLGVKIQTNYGLILLLSFWFIRQQGLKALAPGILASAGVVAVTLLLWPGWPALLVGVYGNTQFGYSNASLWPYGIAAWPLALLAKPVDSSRRLRMVAAASLLGTPYFTLHHCLTLIALTDSPTALPLTWLPMIMIFQTRDWAMYAWVIPLAILIFEAIQSLLKDR